MCQQGMQWKHICSILQSLYAFCGTWQCPRNYTNSTVVYHTHVSLVGTQLNTFLTTPTLPVHGSTRHAVETHLLNSAVTLCILWHLTVSQKLHQLNSGVPHTCLTSGDSAKHFSNHPYPSCTWLNKACSGSAFTPSAVILCILWHLIESQKLQTYTKSLPHTCLTSVDSAKHFSNHPYPSCTCLNKVCTGHTFAPFCSHCMHSVTLDSVPKITNIHQRCSSHMSH